MELLYYRFIPTKKLDNNIINNYSARLDLLTKCYEFSIGFNPNSSRNYEVFRKITIDKIYNASYFNYYVISPKGTIKYFTYSNLCDIFNSELLPD